MLIIGLRASLPASISFIQTFLNHTLAGRDARSPAINEFICG